MYGASRREFQVTLPSSSSAAYFPDNTLTDYTTKLAVPLELDGSWEMALIKLHYPHRFVNVDHDTMVYFELRGLNPVLPRRNKDVSPVGRIFGPEPTDNPRSRYLGSFAVPKGYYKNVRELGSFITRALNEVSSQVKISFTLYPGYVTEFMNEGTAQVILATTDSRIFDILGIGTTRSSTQGEETISSYQIRDFGLTGKANPDNLPEVSRIYVYNDLIKHEVVGDYVVPLLDVVSVAGESGGQVEYVFNPPFYHEVHATTVNEIRIKLACNTGLPVPFEGRKGDEVIVRLAFRRRQLASI